MQVIFTAPPSPPSRSGQYGRIKWRYNFAKAFVRWQERCEKCIRIGGSYVEKS
jgi:hypothetical protein